MYVHTLRKRNANVLRARISRVGVLSCALATDNFRLMTASIEWVTHSM